MFHASLDTCSGEACRKPAILPPEEKCSPTARSTMTRTWVSSSRASKQRRSWSRCSISMTFKGGRSRTTSARSRARSSSTRKPSSFCKRGSEKGVIDELLMPLDSRRRSVPARGALGGFHRIFAGGELAAKELADRRFRNFGHENIAPRSLEIRQARSAAERVEVLGLDRRAAFDEGGDDFAPALVRQADDGDFRHGGMERKTRLDFY